MTLKIYTTFNILRPHEYKLIYTEWFILNIHVKHNRLQHNQRDIYDSNLDNLDQSSSEVQFRVVECVIKGHVGLALMQHFLFFILNLFSLTSICPARFS